MLFGKKLDRWKGGVPGRGLSKDACAVLYIRGGVGRSGRQPDIGPIIVRVNTGVSEDNLQTSQSGHKKTNITLTLIDGLSITLLPTGSLIYWEEGGN